MEFLPRYRLKFIKKKIQLKIQIHKLSKLDGKGLGPGAKEEVWSRSETGVAVYPHHWLCLCLLRHHHHCHQHHHPYHH